jgi:hypothetical protein
MESFEITFFCCKGENDESSINKLTKQFELYDNFNKKNVIEFFNDEEKDFVEFRLSIFDFVITPDNFNDVFSRLSQFASSVFQGMPSVRVATGVYELTYYLTENKKSILEFDKEFMMKFPIVFFRVGQDYGGGQQIFSDDNINCIFYKEAQDIL